MDISQKTSQSFHPCNIDTVPGFLNSRNLHDERSTVYRQQGLPELSAADLVLIHGAQQDQENAASRLAASIKRQLGSGKSSS